MTDLRTQLAAMRTAGHTYSNTCTVRTSGRCPEPSRLYEQLWLTAAGVACTPCAADAEHHGDTPLAIAPELVHGADGRCTTCRSNRFDNPPVWGHETRCYDCEERNRT